MKVIYICTLLFLKEDDGIYALPSCSDPFFQKYLVVFDSVRVLGEKLRSYLDKSSLMKMRDPNISVRIVPANTRPQDFINDTRVRRILEEEIKQADALIIKPASRKGMMAIDIAKRLKKPYMIEMTGDIHNAMKQHPNLLKRMYAPFLYWNIKRNIYDCRFGLYVSDSYLQTQYPIRGKMCGCSDTFIEETSNEVIEKRLSKIEKLNDSERIDMALIGFYQGTMKGVDTAIRALSHLPNNYHLSILGNGSENNRKKWIDYSNSFGVYDRVHFPCPLPSSQDVMRWLDNMDLFVLPTRSEGFCRCLVEALSRGVPCFATNICSIPEVLEDEFMFPIGNDIQLSKQILLLLQDKEKMKKVAKDNYNKAKAYYKPVLDKRRNEFLCEFRNYAENGE